MVQQFAYVHKVIGISLLSGKNKSVATVFHTHSRQQQQQQNPNHQTLFSEYLLHGLSLSKSLIKNHTTLFGLGQVINRIKHN